MSSYINDIDLIFSENPVSRAYLYLFLEEGKIQNKIILMQHNSVLNKFFMKLQFNYIFRLTKKYLKCPDVLILINEIEKNFNLKKNFLINMYNFENIYKFRNLIYANGPDINTNKNINFFKNLDNENYLNTSNKIYKNIFNSNKNFYHIHPGYIYKVRGCDGTLNSIINYDSIGASFYLMNKKIDSGDILQRFEQKYYKIKFPNFHKYNGFDLYNIWFSFFDPALRVSFLKKLLNENILLNDFENVDKKNEENNYFKFVEKKKLKEVFVEKIFKD